MSFNKIQAKDLKVNKPTAYQNNKFISLSKPIKLLSDIKTTRSYQYDMISECKQRHK